MNNQQIAVIGSGGQLGTDFCSEALMAGYKVVSVDYPQIDITDRTSVDRWIRQCGASVIVNCAAHAGVDDCEKEQERAFALNAKGPEYIATACTAVGARMVHISTDYVFSGKKNGPYVETDLPDPATVYGKSKLAGERNVASICPNHQIFRIAWLYGLHGKNFVFTIRALAAAQASAGRSIKVVNDQYGSPTSTREVCRQILHAQRTDLNGIFHATCEGSCTWFDFAATIINASSYSVTILPCTTEEFPRPAPRPKNSVLENKRLKDAGLMIMNDWKQAFEDFLHDEEAEKGSTCTK